MTTPAGWHPDPEGSGQLRWWDGQQWTSALQPHTTGPTPSEHMPEAPAGESKRKKWPWLVGVVVALIVIVGVVNSTGESSDDSSSSPASTTQSSTVEKAPVTTKSTTSAEAPLPPPPPVAQVAPAETVPLLPTVTVKPEPTAPARAESGMTGGQRNAVRAARDYLDYTAFSRQGLIDQLEFEDYSTADATFAVDYVAPDWNEQAAKAAEDYLDYTAFSRQGLIDQLMFEGYTSEQAHYGVAQTGI